MATLEEKFDSLDSKVDKLSEGIAEIKTALKYNGSGLIPAFVNHCADYKEFQKEYYNFRKIVFIALGSLAGSGALVAGAIELFG